MTGVVCNQFGCYCARHGRWNGQCHKGVYLNLSSRVLIRSHILYMWQMVLANILVKGWIINPYVYWFLYSSSDVLVLPPTILKLSTVVVWPVVVLWSYICQWNFKVFFEFFPKCSWGFSNIFFITCQPIIFKSIYHITLSSVMTFVLRVTRRFLTVFLHWKIPKSNVFCMHSQSSHSGLWGIGMTMHIFFSLQIVVLCC